MKSLHFENYKAIRGKSKSGRYKQSKTKFRKLNLEGQRVNFMIPSNTIDIYTRLEILLGSNLFGHTDTLTEAGNSIDELYMRNEIQNDNNIEMLSTKFLVHKWNFFVKFYYK